MIYLVDNYKINFFQFEDDLFANNKKWVDEFCGSLKEKNLDVRFSISSRANILTEELILKLKSAGCIHIGVGFESGSQRILDSMKKHVKVENNYNAYKLLKKHDLILGAPTIIGMPDETHESIKETLKFINDCKIDDAANYYATPYPNSEIYLNALKEGLVLDEERYLEKISNSDASEFKINLTKLSDTDLKYYTWLLRDACRKNILQKGLNNNKIGKAAYYKFIIKHFGIKILYHTGLFDILWNLNNKIEIKKRNKYKI